MRLSVPNACALFGTDYHVPKQIAAWGCPPSGGRFLFPVAQPLLVLALSFASR